MKAVYYVVGDRVYSRGKGDKEKALVLKRVVGSLEDVERAHFKFSGGWWVLVRGSQGWLCAFSTRRDAPETLRFQLLAMLDKLEKEVGGEWRLL